MRLKEERLQRQEALANVRRELQALEAVLNEAVPALSIDGVMPLTDALQAINTQLWDVEDGLRLFEAEQRFDQEVARLSSWGAALGIPIRLSTGRCSEESSKLAVRS